MKISALLCEKEEEAKGLEGALKQEKNFADMAQRLVASGERPRRPRSGSILKPKDMDPDLGRPSPTWRWARPAGRPDEIRIRDPAPGRGPDARTPRPGCGRDRSPSLMQAGGGEAQDEALKKKYVTIRQDVLKSVDYDSSTPGFEHS